MSDRSVRDHLRRNAERAPDATAVTSWRDGGADRVTWAELEALANRTAAAGRRLDGPVVVVVDNSVASVAAVLGLAIAGVDVAPVERATSQLTEKDSVLRQVTSGRVVCPGEAVDALSRAGLSCTPFEELAGTGSAGNASDAEVLQLTSGSTGAPKAARQTVRNILRGGMLYRDVHRITAADTILAPMPFAHSFPLVGGVATALVSGASLLAMAGFTTGAMVECLNEATVVLGTPLVYRMLGTVLPPGRPPGRLRVALSSGGPLPAEVGELAGRRLGVPVRQVYGSTETGLISCQYDRAQPWPAGCAGTLADGVEARFETENGERAVLWRTGTMFLGYAGTGGPRPGGFFRSGDAVEIDEHGHVFVTARKDTFVNVGGRKVNPGRVERVLTAHPGVVEACVYGVVNGIEEEEIHAAVVLTAGTAIADLVTFCRGRLMPYEVPHHVREVAALPRTSLGKLDRRALVEGT